MTKWIFSSALIVVAFIAVVVFRNWRIKNKHQNEISMIVQVFLLGILIGLLMAAFSCEGNFWEKINFRF
jgi:RsiW-degrading membrane proteinase PrsW (M82 family)